MKSADVILLYKSKSKENPVNYRPISLLITISKLLEKIIYKRTYSFLEDTDQIYHSQYGFRSKYSCEQAVSELLGKIVKKKEIKKDTLAVFLDLSKAFNSLDHAIPGCRLERYGIHGLPLQWFDSYLSDHLLRAKCSTNEGMTYSNEFMIDFGTPQGSCLGPLLFLLFTNDLHLHLEHCKCILFADDTTLYISHGNKNYMEWCIQQDLITLQDWFCANKLTLNLNKTVYMHFGCGNQLHYTDKYKITIDSMTLPVVTHTKFLGMWIDNQLNWQTHFDYMCLKIIRNTQLLKVSKNHLNMDTKKLIYYAHIYSHLVYGCTTWGNMLKTCQLKKLQKLQNKCIELITGRTPTVNCYQSLKVLRVAQLIKLQNLKLGHKVQYPQLPTMILKACTSDVQGKSLQKGHGYNTRRKEEPNHPKLQTDWYKTSFLVKSIVDFQGLPTNVRNIENFDLFISSCKSFLLTN